MSLCLPHANSGTMYLSVPLVFDAKFLYISPLFYKHLITHYTLKSQISDSDSDFYFLYFCRRTILPGIWYFCIFRIRIRNNIIAEA